MDVHANAKLGPAGRFALTEAIAEGMTQKAAAAAFCVSPATAHRWWHRRLGPASRSWRQGLAVGLLEPGHTEAQGCSPRPPRNGSASADVELAGDPGSLLASPAIHIRRCRRSSPVTASPGSRGGRRTHWLDHYNH